MKWVMLLGLIILGVLALDAFAVGAEGQMANCPLSNRWAIATWTGPDNTPIDAALATCGQAAVTAAYWLNPETQGWDRYMAGRPDITTLTELDNSQGILTLGSATAPATPISVVTPTSTPTPSPTPSPTGQQGLSRENPVPLGHTLTVPPGWEMKVLSVDWDAWPEVQAENMFNDPPQSGYRMIMVRVSAKNVQSGGDTDLAWEADFAFVGSQNVVRKPFDPSCGVIPDEIWAELFPGGSTEGNVCFQAPTGETHLVMIAEFSWLDQDRRYFALQ